MIKASKGSERPNLLKKLRIMTMAESSALPVPSSTAAGELLGATDIIFGVEEALARGVGEVL